MRYFVITNHARNGRGLPSYRRAVVDQASFRIFGGMAAGPPG
jgi:hypothetical protein